MIKTIRFLCSVMWIALIPAAPSFAVSSKPRVQDVQNISVTPKTEVISHFKYVGTTDAVLGGIFAGLGGAAAAVANKAIAEGPDAEGAHLQAKMLAAGFSLPDHFRAEVVNHIQKAGLFRSLASSPSEASLQVILRRHGIVVAPTGFKRMKPVMAGSLELRDNEGKHFWKDDAVLENTHNLVRGQTYEEYEANISLLVADFKILSSHLAKKMVDELARNRGREDSTPEKSATASRQGAARHRSR